MHVAAGRSQDPIGLSFVLANPPNPFPAALRW